MPEVGLTNGKLIALDRPWSLTDPSIAGGCPDGLQGQGKGMLCEECVQRRQRKGACFAVRRHGHQRCVREARGCLEQACPGTEPGRYVCPHHMYPCLLGTSSRTQLQDKVFSCICSFSSLQHLAYRQERAIRKCTTSLPEKAAVLHKFLS